MKRRKFIKNVSLSSAAVPFLFRNHQYSAISKKLFEYSRGAEDRVLVVIRLNGGNDGLNTLIPIDQYDNLVIQRPHVLLPENTIIPVTAENGFHAAMTGMASMFNNGNLAIVQNVGYPEQNRSHFRSMDIWSYGTQDEDATTGWLGRHLDTKYPNFPSDYPNEDYPDPFAISMGYEVSSTCQGLLGNFSHTVTDPFQDVNVGDFSSINDGTYYGSHMEYLSTIIAQTNAYGQQVNAAANAGNSMSQLYDPENRLAMQLKSVAQMISGGLKTKIYILNLNGFDTHSEQVVKTDTTQGAHADLLRRLSNAVEAFQEDLQLLGIEKRVAGMTFSEFGRQIASNASDGTDHGDAAPLFLFGSCLSNTIIGPNPVIQPAIQEQAGIPLQIDFRDVYASLLKDWFEVSEAEVQQLFDHQVSFMPLMQACNLGISDLSKLDVESLVYPNPCVKHATLKVISKGEWVKAEIVDISGRSCGVIYDGNLDLDEHHIPFETKKLPRGTYRVIIQKKSGNESVQFLKMN
ncbi:MAG: DUF1501 domain-containing protein [Bacteroidetes bacterium]|nr:MAG: DUF1501 domain-containing protein [Bacteroidota bacterium]